MDNAVDANNSRANLREGTGGERGAASTHRREKNGGGGEPKSKKTIPREKRGETGPRTSARSRSSVHREESSHLHNSEKVGLWEGAPGALESPESGEGPRRQGELGQPGRTGAAAGAAAFCSGPRWVFVPLPFVPAPRACPPAPPPQPPPKGRSKGRGRAGEGGRALWPPPPGLPLPAPPGRTSGAARKREK